MEKPCEHVWEPLLGWIAHYQCLKCDTFGCKQSNGIIASYKCGFKACCTDAIVKAVFKKRNTFIKEWRCKEHRNMKG